MTTIQIEQAAGFKSISALLNDKLEDTVNHMPPASVFISHYRIHKPVSENAPIIAKLNKARNELDKRSIEAKIIFDNLMQGTMSSEGCDDDMTLTLELNCAELKSHYERYSSFIESIFHRIDCQGADPVLAALIDIMKSLSSFHDSLVDIRLFLEELLVDEESSEKHTYSTIPELMAALEA
jgi:hypothetical protein